MYSLYFGLYDLYFEVIYTLKCVIDYSRSIFTLSSVQLKKYGTYTLRK